MLGRLERGENGAERGLAIDQQFQGIALGIGDAAQLGEDLEIAGPLGRQIDLVAAQSFQDHGDSAAIGLFQRAALQGLDVAVEAIAT